MKRFLLLFTTQLILTGLLGCTTPTTSSAIPSAPSIPVVSATPTTTSIPSPIPILTETPTKIPKYEYWFFALDDTSLDLINSATLSPEGGLYVVGNPNQWKNSGVWLTKIDPFGVIDWQEIFTGKPAHGNAVSWLPGGNIAVAGSLEGKGYLILLNGNGNQIWQKSYQVSERDSFLFLSPTSDGYLAFTGKSDTGSDQALWLGKIDNSGDLYWQNLHFRTAYPYSGTLLLFPEGLTSVGNGKVEIFYSAAAAYNNRPSLVQFSPQGNLIQDRVFENRMNMTSAYWQSKDGSYTLAFFPNLFAASDNNGDVIFENEYRNITISAVIKLTEGNFIVGGQKHLPDEKDIGWLMKVDQKGKTLWERIITGTNDIDKILESPDGNLYVIAKDDSEMYTSYKIKRFILRLNSNGEIPGCSFIIETDSPTDVQKSVKLPYLAPASHFEKVSSVNINYEHLELLKTNISQTWICQGNP